MRFKYVLFIFTLILLFSVACVSASQDVNSTTLTVDDSQEEVLTDHVFEWDIEIDDEIEILPETNQEINIKNSPFDYSDNEDCYNYSLTIDDNDVEIIKTPSSVYFDASNLSFGSHKFQLKFLGNNFFKPTNKIGYLNVSYICWDVPDKIIYPTDMFDCDEDLINVYLAKNTSGTLSFFVDDKLFDTVNLTANNDRVYGLYSFIQPAELNFGNSTFRVVLNDGTRTIEKSKKVEIDYTLKCEDYLAYGDTILRIVFPTQLKDNINVKFNGIKYKINADYDELEGYTSFYIKFDSILNVGDYPVEISYTGSNDKYQKKTVSKILSVRPIIDYDYQPDKFYLKIPKDAKGSLVADIYDYDGKLVKSYSQKVSNGEASLILSKSGVYGMFAYVIGRYDGSDYNVSEIINKNIVINPNFNVPASMVVGENKYVSINLPGKQGTLLVKTFGKKYSKNSADLVNGKASIPLNKLPTGKYTVSVTFKEKLSDGKTKSYNEIYSLIIYDHINFVNKDKLYYGSAKLKIQAYGENGKVLAKKYITIKINGKYFKKIKTNKNGVAYLKFTSKHIPKKYKITATYKKYKTSQKIKIKQVLSFNKITVKKSAKKLTITVKLAKGNTPIKGKKVTVKFNGKTYKAKTNKNGIGNINVKNSVLKKLKVGKKVTVKATYLKTNVTKTLKVKK